MNAPTIRKRLTKPFLTLQIGAVAAGIVLSFLGWRQVQHIRHVKDTAWPTANAAMEMRLLQLQEKIALAWSHWRASSGQIDLAALRDGHREQLGILQEKAVIEEEDLRRLHGLEERYHEQVEAMWRDLEHRAGRGEREPELGPGHRTVMQSLDATVLSIDSLLTAVEAQASEAMSDLGRQASTYSYIGMGTLVSLGIALLALMVVFKGQVQKQVVEPVEHMVRDVETRDTGERADCLAIPDMPELGLLARTINNYLRQLEAEQKRLREMDRHLVQAERMASVGIVASGIVHNLRSPLTAISGYAQLLEKKDPDQPGLAQIVDAAQQMDRMIEEILARGRATAATEQTDLNALLTRELSFLQADLTFKHEVEKELCLAEDLPPVECVYTDLSQVFANLLRNAVDAMRGSERKKLRVATMAVDGSVAVEVADTGCGIQEADLPRLFEPFFTTKAGQGDDRQVVGTGLGLYTVKQILDRYGGATIELDTAESVGTTFTVRIPLSGGGGPKVRTADRSAGPDRS